MSLLLSLFSNPAVLAVLAGIAAFFGYGMHQRRAGAAKERQKQSTERLKAARKAKDVEDEVDGLGASDLDERFRDWLRDK